MSNNWDHFITFPFLKIYNVGGEGVRVRAAVCTYTTVTCASHSCLSALTMQVWRTERGLFRGFTAASSGCVCQRRNLGMCFLNKQEEKRERTGQRELLEGLGMFSAVVKLEFPRVCAFLQAIEPGAFKHDRAAIYWPDTKCRKDKLKTSRKSRAGREGWTEGRSL